MREKDVIFNLQHVTVIIFQLSNAYKCTSYVRATVSL